MFVASIAECTSRLTYVTASHQRKHGACVAEVEGCGSGYTVPLPETTSPKFFPSG